MKDLEPRTSGHPPTGPAISSETSLWHVTVTVAGDPQDLSGTHAALVRLQRERPFIHSIRYAEERAELRYWEESANMVDAASLALRLWNEHRTSAHLPNWSVVGLEVVAEDTYRTRGSSEPRLAASVAPRRF